METVKFAGYDWKIKQHDYPVGPGPNLFSPRCVSIHHGELKLEVIQENNSVFCGEIILKKSLGYGKYCIFLSSRIDLLAPELVLGLFTWSNDAKPHHCEIDIEFSKWNNETVTNSQYVVQPGKIKGNLLRYDTKLLGFYSTHMIEWKPGEIRFLSLHGHYLDPPSKNHIIESWTYKGKSIPVPNNEHFNMNLWKYGGGPLKSRKDSIRVVTIKDFQYFPGT